MVHGAIGALIQINASALISSNTAVANRIPPAWPSMDHPTTSGELRNKDGAERLHRQ